MTDEPSRRSQSDWKALEENRAAEVEKPTTVDLGYIELNKVKALYFSTSGDHDVPRSTWVYDPSGTVESHCPEDRCGEPFKIPSFCEDTDGDQWFLFAICDSHFPSRYLVRGDSFEDAYEAFVESAIEQLGISDEDLPDYFPDNTRWMDRSNYDWDNYTGSYSASGTPVDTDDVQGGEIFLTRIDLRV